MEKVKIGVIGTGKLGRYHTLKYAANASADLVGITDIDGECAKSVAEEAGCRVFSTPEELLREVDAVSIAVPTDLHLNAGLMALQSGVHCLIEKPIAAAKTEAEALLAAAEANGRILQVGHIERFNPALKSLEGIDLNPMFIEAHRLAPFTPRGTEVAVVLDLMIHDIDIILHLVKSPVKFIDASGAAVVSDTADIANARIRFENGCVANLTASRISQKRMRKFRLFQRDAYISIDFNDRQTEVFELKLRPDADDTVVSEIGVGDKMKKVIYNKYEEAQADALEAETSAFIDTVLGKRTEGVTGSEGSEALAVALDILEAMKS